MIDNTDLGNDLGSVQKFSLIFISLLDARGQMLPPPPEPLGGVVIVFVDFFEVVQQLF